MALPASIKDVRPIEVGGQLPRFTLPDRDGKPVDVGALAAQGPVAVIFFRGGWCPYCSAQLGALRKSEAQLRASGVQIIGVSSDSLETMRSHDTTFQAGFKLLADPLLVAAKALGVAYQPAEAEVATLKHYQIDLEKQQGHKLGHLPAPSVFIAAKGGRIAFRFVSPDIATRLDEGKLLQALEAVKPV